MKDLVVPFGFYGAGNIGDEATLNGFAALVRQTRLRARVSISSRNPEHTAAMEPEFRYFNNGGPDVRRWIAKLRAAGHVMAGGTPIMDCLGDWPLSELVPLLRSIDRWRVPAVFVGVGVEPLRLESSVQMVRDEIIPRTKHWTVRSEKDRERLQSWGAKPEAVTVAADMAWLIDPVTTEYGERRLRDWGIDTGRPMIGVNLVNENGLFDRHPEMAAALAASLDEACRRLGTQAIFLANEVRDGATFDRAAAQQVLVRMEHPGFIAPAEYLSPRQMMSIIACCSMTISMRYHFCLFSALQGVPFLAIERTSKISDLTWDLGWEASLPSPFGPDVDLYARMAALHADLSGHREKLARDVGRMRERAGRNAEGLFAVVPGSAPSGEYRKN